MRNVTISIEVPQSAELSAQLVQMILSERNEIVKKLLEDILEQLRRDYAKNGVEI